MKSSVKAGSCCSIIVSILILVALSLSSVAAEAAIYVDGKKCAGDAFEQPDGNWKCRTVDGDVAVGAGYSAEKLRPGQKIRKKDILSAPELPSKLQELTKPAMAK